MALSTVPPLMLKQVPFLFIYCHRLYHCVVLLAEEADSRIVSLSFPSVVILKKGVLPQQDPRWATKDHERPLCGSQWPFLTDMSAQKETAVNPTMPSQTPTGAKCYIQCNTCVIGKSEKLPFL